MGRRVLEWSLALGAGALFFLLVDIIFMRLQGLPLFP